jgi:hypothetical protein
MLTPVMLPPGLAKLEIKPDATRSSARATIGIVLLACAARVAESPKVIMTLARFCTSASANAEKCWRRPSSARTSETQVAALDPPDRRQRPA